MTNDASPESPQPQADLAAAIPPQVLHVFRGIGQIVFQENALTGLLFVIGIAIGSPLLALGIVVGALIGTLTASILKFNSKEIEAGIFGFNAALVGIATFFFFVPGVVSVVVLIVGSALACVLTHLARTKLPFPTYTMPFILMTWVIYFVAPGLGAEKVVFSGDPLPTSSVPFYVEATAHGIGQIMFQATLWSGIFFLAGLAVSDWRHALLVLAGSVVGMLLASYHLTAGSRALDPERLIERIQFDNVALGLYGYNATLAAVALFLWRPSLIAPILGMLLSVPLTELFPLIGVPALTAPFVVATWIVISLGCIERRFTGSASAS